MIIVRTPLRISIGGGGSDLPSYYEKFGSFFISAAIDKYIYISINKTFTNEYNIRYSSQELVTDPGQIQHPIVREAIKLHRLGPLEIVSLADIPAGTGLGSSGSFGPCRARRGNGCQFLASEKKCPAWRVDGPRSGYDWLSFA